ncbi:MAG: GIY-YIG nuclease family protein [Candidatus Omnitrophica bacterium]|nr:GIY-YIG nuclease family protein [Candidatus Omnitrophota bacterium]
MRKFKRTGKFYVYIVQCQDNTYYTGYTNDLERRFTEHQGDSRGARYTRWKKASKVVWSKEYRQFKAAFKLEKIIKKLTRIQKEALVRGRRLDKVLEKNKSS